MLTPRKEKEVRTVMLLMSEPETVGCSCPKNVQHKLHSHRQWSINVGLFSL